MSFVSDDFVLFFLVVCIGYFAIPYRFRWGLLLGSSIFFYAYWRIDYLLLFVFVIAVNYLCALLISRTANEHKTLRRLLLGIALSASLGTLFVFKYFNFFIEPFNDLLAQFGVNNQIRILNILLPVGISFYTFQAFAYTIDVYRRTIPAERHFGIFATFIAFFPQLVAGPIERASHLLPQFRQEKKFNYAGAVNGLQIILWGAFKKVVIADRLAAYVNTVYNDVHSYTGLHLILATVFFAIQIYCDFSGYSDIAIGAARILGFDLMQNFRQPYFSRSIREFWRRWHISLSTWFRDYLYFPLGGNRVSIPRNYINLLIVFVASGLWHGANWTFLIWGMLHGLYIVVEAIIEKRLEHQNSQFIGKSWHWAGILLTFGLVTFAWIFFRANSISDAFYVIAHLFDLSNGVAHIAAPFNAIAPLAIGEIDLVMACFTISILIIYDGLANRAVSRSIPISITRPWRWLLYYAAVFLILYSASTSQPAFIYFQF